MGVFLPVVSNFVKLFLTAVKSLLRYSKSVLICTCIFQEGLEKFPAPGEIIGPKSRGYL